MQVRVDIVHQKLHVLSELHRLPEELVVREVLAGLRFQEPSVVELKLDSFDREQKPKDLVISLDSVLIEEQVQRPLDVIVKR